MTPTPVRTDAKELELEYQAMLAATLFLSDPDAKVIFSDKEFGARVMRQLDRMIERIDQKMSAKDPFRAALPCG